MDKSTIKIDDADISKRFEEVTEDKINSWEVNQLYLLLIQQILLDSKIKNRNFGKLDNLEEPFSHRESKETRTRFNDVERTRVKERNLIPDFKEHCMTFIINYLELNNITYKNLSQLKNKLNKKKYCIKNIHFYEL